MTVLSLSFEGNLLGVTSIRPWGHAPHVRCQPNRKQVPDCIVVASERNVKFSGGRCFGGLSNFGCHPLF